MKENVFSHFLLSVFIPPLSWTVFGTTYLFGWAIVAALLANIGAVYLFTAYLLGWIINPWMAWAHNQAVIAEERKARAVRMGHNRRREDDIWQNRR